jgi:hypothetical protein
LKPKVNDAKYGEDKASAANDASSVVRNHLISDMNLGGTHDRGNNKEEEEEEEREGGLT